MKRKSCILPFSVVFWCIIFQTFLFSQSVRAQNDRSLYQYMGYSVYPKSITYDGGVLMFANRYYSETEPDLSKIIKYSLEGKEQWQIQLNNIVVTDLIETSDLGFAVCGVVNIYPELPRPLYEEDSIRHSCLLKFDKCSNLQWARYLNSYIHNRPEQIIEDSNGELVISIYGFNGYERNRKPTTVVKFNSTGTLLSYNSFEGNCKRLVSDVGGGNIYILQDVFAPSKNNPNQIWSSAGIKKLNKDLHIIEKANLCYDSSHEITSTELLINKGNLIVITTAYSNDTAPKLRTRFTYIDNTLKIRSKELYSSKMPYDLGIGSAIMLGDTIAALCRIDNPDNPMSEYSPLRLFDPQCNILKEGKPNMGFTAHPVSLLKVDRGEKLLVGVIHSAGRTDALSMIFLYDRHLNPVPFPTVSPVRGYDWLCKSHIPKTRKIDVDQVALPLQISVDSTAPDWNWLLSIKEPDPQNIGRISKGWFVWPQPAAMGAGLHLKMTSGGTLRNANVHLQARFFDMQGRQVATLPTMPEGEGQWGIASLNLPSSGLYLADLVDMQTGVSVGRLRVMVE